MELAPYTAARLGYVLDDRHPHKPQLFAPVRVTKVEKAEGGGFNVTAEWQEQDDDDEQPATS